MSTASTAAAAEMIGIPVMREFFGEAIGNRLADAGKRADLVVGNNVYAHVPDINDFTRGLKAVLKPFGTITLEFPHLMRLIEHTQFDTIYHEHFSYLSLYTADRIFCAAGLRIWDVEQLLTHGGSLRIYAGHLVEDHAVSPLVKAVLEEEAQCGLQDADVYLGFQAKADLIKYDLLEFLIEQKRSGRKVAAYGAAAKGNTLLNYAGVRPDLLPFVCDAAPAKQGKLLPGSHIPIFHPHAMEEFCPDYVLVLPWNIVDEVNEQNKRIRTAGAKFVTAVPRLKIV